jgi:hypothetical protein
MRSFLKENSDVNIDVDRLIKKNKMKKINNTSIKVEILLRTLKRVR